MKLKNEAVAVCGAGGFIGGHLVQALLDNGVNVVRAVDIKRHEYVEPPADEFIVGDLRDQNVARAAVDGIEEVYQLAADMGGAGYIFTGEHDAAVMHNSATINLNTLEFGHQAGVKKFFYSSSACIILRVTRPIRRIRSVPKTRPTRLLPILNMNGETVQRAVVSVVHPEPWFRSAHCAIPQHLWD